MGDAVQKATMVFREHDGLLRASRAIALGIAPRTLYAMRDAGIIQPLSRGLYRLTDLPLLSNVDLVQAALSVSRGVVCLISAAAYHGLTTQVPHEVYVALPKGVQKPRLNNLPLHFVWMSRESWASGIETHKVDNVSIRIYDAAKTTADCFKFRNKIGMDVVVEILKACLAQRRCSVSDLLKCARVDHVERVMRPYLEALI